MNSPLYRLIPYYSALIALFPSLRRSLEQQSVSADAIANTATGDMMTDCDGREAVSALPFHPASALFAFKLRSVKRQPHCTPPVAA
jgi:hypothetical protein